MRRLFVICAVALAACHSSSATEVIASAVIPTIIADLFFLPHHLLSSQAGPATLEVEAIGQRRYGGEVR